MQTLTQNYATVRLLLILLSGMFFFRLRIYFRFFHLFKQCKLNFDNTSSRFVNYNHLKEFQSFAKLRRRGKLHFVSESKNKYLIWIEMTFHLFYTQNCVQWELVLIISMLFICQHTKRNWFYWFNQIDNFNCINVFCIAGSSERRKSISNIGLVNRIRKVIHRN